MQFTVDIPEDMVPLVIEPGADGACALLEAVVAESYRADRIGPKQVRELLQFETRLQVDEFLHAHDAYGYKQAELHQDLEVLLFTPTSEAAVRGVEPDTKCSTKRL